MGWLLKYADLDKEEFVNRGGLSKTCLRVAAACWEKTVLAFGANDRE